MTFFFFFWATPGGAQGLFLTLCSGVTPRGALGTVWGTQAGTHTCLHTDKVCADKCLTYCIISLNSNHDFCWKDQQLIEHRVLKIKVPFSYYLDYPICKLGIWSSILKQLRQKCGWDEILQGQGFLLLWFHRNFITCAHLYLWVPCSCITLKMCTQNWKSDSSSDSKLQ